MRTVAGLLLQPIRELPETACTECPVELLDGECYQDEPGVERFCTAEREARCDLVTTGRVVRCDGRPALRCDGETWIPATRLYRYVGGDGNRRLVLTAELVVVNVGDVDVDLDNVLEHLRIERPASGEAVPGSFELFSASAYDAPAESSATYTISAAAVDERGEILAAPELAVRLRASPWDGSPFTEPVPVTIIDAPPP